MKLQVSYSYDEKKPKEIDETLNISSKKYRQQKVLEAFTKALSEHIIGKPEYEKVERKGMIIDNDTELLVTNTFYVLSQGELDAIVECVICLRNSGLIPNTNTNFDSLINKLKKITE